MLNKKGTASKKCLGAVPLTPLNVCVNMKRLFSIALLITVVLQLFACNSLNQELPNNTRIRLGLDKYDDWGNEAVAFIKPDEEYVIYIPKIAILDTGCNLNSNMVLPGHNVLDNSQNISDTDGHGTLVTGKLISLVVNAEIIPIKIAESENIEHSSLSNGLKKAISFQPDIISLSLGTQINYQDIANIIRDAIDRGIIIIAAAGNQYGTELLFPAAYDGVISVIARDINNMDCAYNNKSKEKRSFSAPGEHIMVEDEYMSGSSIAVSYVTALISQMLAITGKNKLLSSDEIMKILSETALYPTKCSYGLIQYEASISKLYSRIRKEER